MKLLYFTDRDLRLPNAETVHVLEVVRSLAVQGHDIGLVAPVDIVPPPGVQLFVYDGGNPVRNRVRRLLQQLVIAPFAASRQMRKGRYDGMYVRLTIPLLLTTWILRWACARRPLIFEINGIDLSELGLIRRLMFAPILPVEGYLLRRASALVASSEGIRTDLITRHRPPCVVTVPNGVNPDTFRPQGLVEARRQLGLVESAPIIGFVGNFAHWHGVEVLIRAFPAIRAKHPNARLLLVGGGAHRDAIEAEIGRLGIAANVDMVGAVPHELIPTYINACSCCVSPAVPIGEVDPGRNSLKVFEYLACGVPVVLSDLPGVADVVKKRHLGVAVEPANPAALAEAIEEALSYDQATLDRIRRDAREAVIRDYSWDANAARLAELFKEYRPGIKAHAANQPCGKAGPNSDRSMN